MMSDTQPFMQSQHRLPLMPLFQSPVTCLFYTSDYFNTPNLLMKPHQEVLFFTDTFTPEKLYLQLLKYICSYMYLYTLKEDRARLQQAFLSIILYIGSIFRFDESHNLISLNHHIKDKYQINHKALHHSNNNQRLISNHQKQKWEPLLAHCLCLHIQAFPKVCY